METIFAEIWEARRAAAIGEYVVAERRVRGVIELIDEVKVGDDRHPILLEIRGYIAEAGYALLQVDSPAGDFSSRRSDSLVAK